jgi:BirA family biotin operon repressor/biotin-[acetyl-CoA-carboxylase] ligase
MLIFTDNPDYSQHILTSSVHMRAVEQRSRSEILSKISRQLFPKSEIFFGSSENTVSFEHFFISEHVPFSQYDMLLQFAKLNPDFRENILCFAGSGNNFHGFRQRKWTSVAGNIHLSVLFHPGQQIKHAEVAFLLLAANAVIQTINHLNRIREKAMIRWVNDITINNSKVGGVLAQTQIQGNIIDKVVLGIGINVDRSPEIENDQFVNTATHINDHIEGDAYSLNQVLEILISRLEKNYFAVLDNNYQDLINYYINHSLVIGKRIEVYSDPREGNSEKVAEGVVSGISENLELILSGQKKLIRKGRIKLSNSA